MLTRRRFSALLLGAAPAGWCAEAPPSAGRKIELRLGDGFEAREADVRAVLLSAASSIWQYCPHTRWEEPGFFVYRSENAPITLFEHRADGFIAIGLTVGGRHWAQFAFQFAHEFCHALAGHANDFRLIWKRGRKPNQWLEESLCETASLFALRTMGENWKTAAPYPNWKLFASALTSYAAERIATAAGALAASSTFPAWFQENQAALREKGTLREKNNVVAAQLLPIFEAEPAGWEAVTFYNLGRRDPEETLATRFGEWSSAAPAEQRAFIGKLGAVFGLAV